ncbi:MAG TPA: tRNA 2-selenouridine(34) synthase MnmH [Pseudomonadales bacterium]
MTALPATDDYATLFLQAIPLLDVRAPIEFAQGAFPSACNIPLLNNREREQIGTCYKQRGQQAAIDLGHTLVSGETKAGRIRAWRQFHQQHPNAMLYCFRGGLRSRTTQQWLHESGCEMPLVAGGYKALRRFLINTIDTAAATLPFIIIGGATGTGKTRVIKALSRAVDLEAAANHKGSSFGRPVDEQPTQINFENRIAIALLHQQQSAGPVFLEDESLLIGRCAIPLTLRASMQTAPRVVIEEPRAVRSAIILEEYVIEQRAAFRATYGLIDGDARYCAALLDSLDRIRKRLGGALHQQLRTCMQAALAEQIQRDRIDGHIEWIESLLEHYYDPMYTYQLSRHNTTALFKGNRAAVTDWCLHHQQGTL